MRTSPNVAELCRDVHVAIRGLPRVRFPFDPAELPRAGIYFFFERGESDGHHGGERIVRVGTHRKQNFRSRMGEHYLIGRPLVLRPDKPAPKDRSIFRKNLGRAWIRRSGIDYLDVWDIDFTSRKKRDAFAHLRDMSVERSVEEAVTGLLRENFSFAAVPFDDETLRIGSGGLESRLIGTLAGCPDCRPAESWLGLDAPDDRIRTGGLWQVQHLRDAPVGPDDIELLRSWAR